MEVDVSSVNSDRDRLFFQLVFHGFGGVSLNLFSSFVVIDNIRFVVFTRGGSGVGELNIRVSRF